MRSPNFTRVSSIFLLLCSNSSNHEIERIASSEDVRGALTTLQQLETTMDAKASS